MIILFRNNIDRGRYGRIWKGIVLHDHKELKEDQIIVLQKIGRLFPKYHKAWKEKFHHHYKTYTKQVYREMNIYMSLKNHENILKLYNIIPPQKPYQFREVSFILEYFPNSLKDVFETNQFFAAQHVKCILFQILCGVKCMHSLNIAHRKLQPRAIRIDENCRIKIDGFYDACYFDVDDHELFIVKDERKNKLGETNKSKQIEKKENDLYGKERKKLKRRALLMYKKFVFMSQIVFSVFLLSVYSIFTEECRININ